MIVRESDKTMEKMTRKLKNSNKKFEGSDKSFEMNLNEEIELIENDWLRIV